MVSWKEKKTRLINSRHNSGSNFNIIGEGDSSRRLEVIYEAKDIKQKYLDQMESQNDLSTPVQMPQLLSQEGSPVRSRKHKIKFKPVKLSKITEFRDKHPGNEIKLKKLKKIITKASNVNSVKREMERLEQRRMTIKFMGDIYTSGPLEVKGLKAIGSESLWWFLWDFIVMIIFIQDLVEVCYK